MQVPAVADSATAALRIDELRKDFGAKAAVDGVSLVVPAGSFFGLVGPNGAGKTTLLSMAVGLLRPDAGSVTLFGSDVWADPVAAKEVLGVLPDGLALPERLTGGELLAFAGSIRGMAPEVVSERSAELLSVLELDRDERTLVIDYSTGMRKKIGLAVALLHRPRLLVLDEPLEAVDPVSAATVKAILRRFVDSGGSVLFSSHVMAVVEQLCDHVAVLSAGRVLSAGPMSEVGAGGLEQRFMELVGGEDTGAEGLRWLAT
ncbi:ABC transporter ATP-binding protein [Actinoalloteichus sp. AHMU CJ021]|uniref:ABC transporter ATP-binding protein n=2 Tax=Pseudonocardiaceae TaxID=2070 RepID=UPI0003F95222|nr:ABC transporter ATP-binding protein [Actinoalloteichus caeruleus]AUS81177.1 ABC transporter ATP-binding protein [Actinoalloteichus sp. AHMU CJ021]